jgi:hypothetical protein
MHIGNRFCQSMTLAIAALLAAVLLAAQFSVAQSQPAAAAPAAAPSPTSPEIHAVLDKIVHPKKVKVGDPVVARMTEPTKLSDGTELPKGTHILGKVTDMKMKADKEGPSKLGLLFTTVQLKDGKEIPVTMALVSVAPHWEQGSVDPVAAENGAASAGRVSQVASAEGRSAGSAGGDTLSKGLGIREPTSVTPEAMRPGVSYLQDITIASYSMGEPGTILQSTKTTVYLDSGSRLLLLAQ